jgi:hypothetical protein
VLNVAGNRESALEGIGGKVERFLADVFRRLRELASIGANWRRAERPLPTSVYGALTLGVPLADTWDIR